MLDLTHKTVRLSLLCCLLCCGIITGCTRATIPLTHISVPVPQSPLDVTSVMELFGGYREGNFSALPWVDAFDAMHVKLSREYPFTEWKALDWDALYDAHRPMILAAAEAEDAQAYYVAVRRYLFGIPDGYVRITTPNEFREAAVGGDYGFSVLPLDDGRVVVADIEADGFAEHSGIQWGAEIIKWNNVPVREALDNVSTLWSDNPPSTHEYSLFERCMMLTRAPVGTEAIIVFRNPGQQSVWGTRLRARRDYFAGLEDLTRQGKPFSEFESPIESRMLPDNIGYIKVYCQAPTIAMPFPARAFRRAVERFKRSDVAGIVLDLRGNSGGVDELAATFAGHFTEQPLFLRELVAYDAAKGGFARTPGGRLTVEPRSPFFGGPVAILIHRNTRDSGQAIVNALAPLPNVFTVGALSTEGTYAQVGGEITMPGGYKISYPIGRHLDAAGNIIITSAADMESRLQPELRTPFTLENLDTFFNQDGDPVLDMAVTEIRRRAGEAN